jgi:GH25 family lysozyme M1 (1,4-beta-N-acetylmuramidase)
MRKEVNKYMRKRRKSGGKRLWIYLKGRKMKRRRKKNKKNKKRIL